MKDLNRISRFTSLSIFTLITTALFLSGCGIAQEGDDSDSAQRRRQNERVERQYQAVRGQYRGSVKIKSPVPQDPSDPGRNQYRDLGATLLLYVGTVQEGSDRSGAPIFHPRLFAQLKFDGVGELDDTTFLVDYNEVTGKVYLQQPQPAGTGGGTSPVPVGTVTSCPVGPRDARLSIDGTILNGEVKNANVFGTNGLLGTLAMKFESSEVVQPIRDQRERLERAYQKIIGTWDGRAGVASESRIVNASSMIYITTDEIQIGEGVSCPQLKAQFRLKDIVGRLDDTFMNATYREGTGELFLTATPPPQNRKVCPMGPQDLKLAVVGRVDNGNLNGILKGSVGDQGGLQMNRVSMNPIAPDDQRDRIRNSYSKLAGMYAGYFKHPTEIKSFPFRIDLDVVDRVVDQYLSCYALKGQYTRPDLTGGAGALVLDADYNPTQDRLVINSTTNSQTGIPGHTYLSMSTIWRESRGGATMQGEMQWWDRVGTLKAQKCSRGTTRVDRKGRCVK